MFKLWMAMVITLINHNLEKNLKGRIISKEGDGEEFFKIKLFKN